MAATDRTPHELALASNVRQRRTERGLSQNDVAAQMSEQGHRWHQATVYKVEAATRTVSVTEGFALAGVLGTTLDKLAGPPRQSNQRWALEASTMRLVDGYAAVVVAVDHLLALRKVAEMQVGPVEPAITSTPEYLEFRHQMATCTPEAAVAAVTANLQRQQQSAEQHFLERAEREAAIAEEG